MRDVRAAFQNSCEQCMMETSFFTSKHQQHSAVWTVPGLSLPSFCLACAVERLENRNELSVRLQAILGELNALLRQPPSNSGSLFQLLSSDRKVLDHFCAVLIGTIICHNSLQIYIFFQAF